LAAIAVLAIIAGGMRGWHLYETRDSPRRQVLIGDAGRYHAWAVGIAAGDWLGSGTFYQPLCHAVLPDSTGDSRTRLFRWVQAGLSAVACVLLTLAGRMFFGRVAGWLAGLILALWPAEVFHTSLLEKSTLTTLLIAALLWTLGATLRSPGRLANWLAAGAALGLLARARMPGACPHYWSGWCGSRDLRRQPEATQSADSEPMVVLGCLLPSYGAGPQSTHWR
jgi:hypothetical protein